MIEHFNNHIFMRGSVAQCCKADTKSPTNICKISSASACGNDNDCAIIIEIGLKCGFLSVHTPMFPLHPFFFIVLPYDHCPTTCTRVRPIFSSLFFLHTNCVKSEQPNVHRGIVSTMRIK